MLVVMIDANAVGVATRRREVENAIDEGMFPIVVLGIPDPCIERWLLGDPPSFVALFGSEPDLSVARDGQSWKTRLIAALEAGGEIVTQGGAEFAEEIVEAMDLYRAGRVLPSLKSFVDDLTAALRQLQATDDGA